MELACFHLSMPLLQRGWLQIPFSWPVVVSSQIPYPKVPMVSNPVLLGPESWVVAHPSACHQKLKTSQAYSQLSGGSLPSPWLLYLSTVPGIPKGVWLLSLYPTGNGVLCR